MCWIVLKKYEYVFVKHHVSSSRKRRTVLLLIVSVVAADGLATSGTCSQHFPATASKVLKRRAPKGVKNSKIQPYFMRVSSLSPRSTPCLPSSTMTPAGSARVASDIHGAVTARTVATSWRIQWTLTTTGLPWRWWACPRVTFHWPSARAYIWWGHC